MAASSEFLLFRLMESFRRVSPEWWCLGNFVNGMFLFSNLTKAVLELYSPIDLMPILSSLDYLSSSRSPKT
jgi:hypothetical protein